MKNLRDSKITEDWVKHNEKHMSRIYPVGEAFPE
jgi:hypothetical protein